MMIGWVESQMMYVIGKNGMDKDFRTFLKLQDSRGCFLLKSKQLQG